MKPPKRDWNFQINCKHAGMSENALDFLPLFLHEEVTANLSAF